MPDNYVFLKNLSNQVIYPRTKLDAIDLTETNGIVVSANTIGIMDGYIQSAYYAEMTKPTTAANPTSAYIAGGTMFTLIGGYTVTDEINTGAPEATNVPNEVAVANLVNTIETITGNTIHSVGEGLVVNGTQMKADFATTQEVLDGSAPRKAVCVQALDEAIRDHADTPDLGGVAALDADYLVGHYDVAPWGVIENIPMDAETLEIKPGHAYRLLNILGPIELTATACPADGFGTEAHIEIYNMGNGYIHFGPTIVIGADTLVANAVNDCTVRFHGGIATLQVEDVVSGIYNVTTVASSGDGSLDEAFNVGSRFVHIESGIVGNAVFETAVTSAKDAIVMDAQYVPIVIGGFKTQGTNTAISINESTKVVTVTAGTFTLADYTIPSGSTVAVSGGGLAVEKVTGAGADSVIDFGRTRIVTRYVPAIVSNCQLKNGYIYPDYDLSYSITDCALTDFSTEQANVPAYALSNRGNAEFVRCLITGNTAYMGAVAAIHANCNITLTGCTFSNNSATYYKNAFDLNLNKGNATVADCSFTDAARNVSIDSASCTFSGTNSFAGIVTGGTAGSLLIASGAIVDLTGNTNTEPIATGGTITFASGGATVKVGNSMASSSYMMDNVTLPAGAKLTNTNVVNLGSANCTVSSGTTASVSGATITSGFAPSRGGFANVLQGTLNVTDCTITGCTAVIGAGINASAGTVNLSGAIFSGNVETDIYGYAGTFTYINGGCTIGVIRSGDTGANWIFTGTNSIGKIETGSGAVVISSGASINLTSSINPGGGVTFAPEGATIVYSNGASSFTLGGFNVRSVDGATGTVVVSGVQSTDGVMSGGTMTMADGLAAYYVDSGKHLTFSDCVASVYFAPDGTAPLGSYSFGGTCTVTRVAGAESIVISSGAVITLGYGLATTNTGGITVLTGGCTVNGNAIPAGTYTNIDSNGTPT